jgi:cell division initiation protein
MITPLEIENKRFSKKNFNGYDPDEVDDFLDDLTKDYETLYKSFNESQTKIDDLNSQVDHYNQIESTLQSTLLLAQSAADEVKQAAQKQADQILREAEQKARESTLDISQEITNKEKELADLKKEFDVYKAKMESLLISQLELLKEINNDKESI